MNPEPKKNKGVSLILFLIGAFLAGWLGVILSAGAKEGYILKDWLMEMEKLLPQLQKHPFTSFGWWNSFSIKSITVCEILYILIVLIKITSKKNYISGKEFGTSKFANPETLNKKLRDKNTPKNKVYKGTMIKVIRIALIFKLHKKVNVTLNMNERRISQNISISMDTRQTGLNNNVLIIGGSGAGKSFYWAKPNMMSMTGSYIATDPKGELLRDTGGILKKRGYNVKVLNLLNEDEMKKSTHYNPFRYIRTETDVIKLCTNIIENTTKKDSKGSDPFFDRDAPNMLLQALIFYILEVYKNQPEKQNFRTFMELMSMAEFRTNDMGGKEDSELDELFNALESKEIRRMEMERREGKIPRKMSSAVLAYNSIMRGAPDTVRSILLTTNAKLANLKSDAVLDLLSDDEMNIPELGAGMNYDGKTKTALYCVIPDSDKSYNFIVGMLYTQVFQELYHQADFVYGGRLPIHVTCMFDEFANVALPDDFTSLESTMRSREISACIIIQNIAQLKELFKDSWETIPGNCDTLIYLGGNEQGSHKYVSEMLDKGTYDKKTSGETMGKQGSSSRNYDKIGRELLTPGEVRKLPNKKCVVMIRGEDPVIDTKIRTFKHPFFKEMNENKFVFDARMERKKKGAMFMGKESFEAIKKQDELENKKSYITVDADQLAQISTEKIAEFFNQEKTLNENSIKDFEAELMENYENRMAQLKKQEEERRDEITLDELNGLSEIPDGIATLLKLQNSGYSKGQVKVILPLIIQGYQYDDLVSIFRTDMKKSEMEVYCSYMLRTKKEQKI